MADLGSRRKIMGWGSPFERPDGYQRAGLELLELPADSHGHRYRRGQLRAGGQLADRRPVSGAQAARAMGIFMLGLPLGCCWLLHHRFHGRVLRQLACALLHRQVPGLVLAVFIFLIREPTAARPRSSRSRRNPCSSRSARCCRSDLLVAGNGRAGIQLRHLRPQRFHGAIADALSRVSLVNASVATGVIVGLTGLIGLDPRRLGRRSHPSALRPRSA